MAKGLIDRVSGMMERVGLDPDDVFAYSAPRVAKIRNHRIGLASFAIKLGVVLFIVIKVLALDHGFLFREHITDGPILVSVADRYALGPESGGLGTCLPDGYCGRDETYTPPTYCNKGRDGQPPSDSSLAIDCNYWSTGNTPFPVGEAGAVTVASRVTVTTWQPTQNLRNGTCVIADWTDPLCRYASNAADTKTRYVADVEQYSIRLMHSVTGEQVRGSGSAIKSQGKLVTPEGKTVKEFPSDDGADILYVFEILEAAGLSRYCRLPGQCEPDEYGGLESPHFAPNNKNKETFRYAGFNVDVFINWKNDWKTPSKLSYEYSARLVPDVENKVVEYNYNDDGDQRQSFNRHSIKISFFVRGDFEKWSFTAFITSLLAGFVLLRFAEFLFKLILTEVVADKQVYKYVLHHRSEDMSCYRDMSPAEITKLREFAAEMNKKGNGIYLEYHAQSGKAEKNAGLADNSHFVIATEKETLAKKPKPPPPTRAPTAYAVNSDPDTADGNNCDDDEAPIVTNESSA
eukprot:m.84141 g.84141  ORF g.84141 m.84141 type:complete len:517 (-) comp12954_c0_seq2:1284-2834(-)